MPNRTPADETSPPDTKWHEQCKEHKTWKHVIEEQHAIAAALREYTDTLDAALALLKPTLNEDHRNTILLAHYPKKCATLGHQADVNISNVGEHLTLSLYKTKKSLSGCVAGKPTSQLTQSLAYQAVSIGGARVGLQIAKGS